MRAMRIFLVLLAATAAATAQTNAPVVRQMSLQDCVQLTLQQNLGLQIARYDPLIKLYTLRADYGGYDPALSLSGQHDHSETGTRLLSGGFSVPGSKSDANSFGAGLGTGLTPWGMTYNFQGNASDNYGKSFAVDTNGFIVPRPFESSSSSASATVSQPLLKNFWIDATRLVIRVDKNNLKISELDLQFLIMQTITTLEEAYHTLIYNRENVVVQQKAVDLAEQLVAENRKRVEVGAMAPLDEKQAESQAATSRASLIAAKSQLAVQEHLVKSLISSNYVAWVSVALEPSGTLSAPRQVFSLQDSWSKGLTLRPDLLKSKLQLEIAGIQLKYARNQLFPQLDVFGTYGYNGSGAEFNGALYDVQQRDRPFYTYGGQISIPLANVRARNDYKSSKVSLQQAVLAVKALEQDIMREIDDDIKLAQSGFEGVAATRAAREYAEDALAAEQKKLEQGKSTTYTVLQMQRDLTAARGAEIQALAAYNNNLSQLSLHEGTTLERLRIDIQAK
jgi:outer membrane protein